MSDTEPAQIEAMSGLEMLVGILEAVPNESLKNSVNADAFDELFGNVMDKYNSNELWNHLFLPDEEVPLSHSEAVKRVVSAYESLSEFVDEHGDELALLYGKVLRFKKALEGDEDGSEPESQDSEP